jgi:hypothetical protein
MYLEASLINNGNAQSSSGRPLMRDNLRSNPFTGLVSIPSNDPYYYNMANFDVTKYYTHKETSQNTDNLHNISNPSAVFAVTGDNAIVDWVFIEIRSAVNSSTVIATRSGLLQRDGDVVDLDGINNLMFENLNANEYYVVARHRNHLGAMSKLVSNGQLVDFTDPQTPMYSIGQVSPQINYTGLSRNNTVKIGYSALWAGDANGDGIIKIEGSKDDRSVIFADVILHESNNTFASSYNNCIGYYNSDIDMDGKVKYTSPQDDFSHLYGQVLNYPLNTKFISNFGLMVKQVPNIED